MTILQTKGFSTIVGTIAAGMQGRISNRFLNFALGSMLRGMAESYAGILLWLQKQNIDRAKLTRLATSYGADADSFVADYGIIVRLGAQAATGPVTFSRATAANATAFIPVGTLVQTQDGSLRFAVYADTTNSLFTTVAGTQGYLLPVLQAAMTVPVAAMVSGSSGNVTAGTINRIGSQTPGIDFVVNAGAFTNGIDGEGDSAFKRRFAAAILGLSRGNLFGTAAALQATAVNVQFTVTEGVNKDGTYHPGYYYIVADDGSGSPSTAFLAAVNTAAQSVRPLGNQLSVFPPTVVLANVAAQIGVLPGYDKPTVLTQVGNALASAVNSLGLGAGLPFYQIPAFAYAVPGVASLEAVTLNGGTADIAASPSNTIKWGTPTLSTL